MKEKHATVFSILAFVFASIGIATIKLHAPIPETFLFVSAVCTFATFTALLEK